MSTMQFIVLIVVCLIMAGLFIRRKEGINHWHHHFEDTQFSALELYNQITAEIQRREMPGVKTYLQTYRIAGILSDEKVFLRITFKSYLVDVCCSAFGKGYYISWWLGEKEPPVLARVPIINNLFGINPDNKSYHQVDISMMFQSAVHKAIMKVIDDASTVKGSRTLSELERQPMAGK